MWKKGFDEIQHPIIDLKKEHRKIIRKGHILNLTIIYKKTHSWHCPWWWKTKQFLPETRNKVRISAYITVTQHRAGNSCFTSMTESRLHPALVGSSLGSLSALFIWRSILDDFFSAHPLSNSAAKPIALTSKWLQNTPLPSKVTTISCRIKAMDRPVWYCLTSIPQKPKRFLPCTNHIILFSSPGCPISNWKSQKSSDYYRNLQELAPITS